MYVKTHMKILSTIYDFDAIPILKNTQHRYQCIQLLIGQIEGDILHYYYYYYTDNNANTLISLQLILNEL